jgi:uncharacterized phiE125 gp8 family phage protein
MSKSGSIVTVITPASASALTLLATVRADLGLVATSDDAWLTAEISAASSVIGSYCRRVWGRSTVRETFRAVLHNREGLLLARLPVVSVASVEVDGAALDAAVYELDAEEGGVYRIEGLNRVSWAAHRVAVTYTAGYLLPGEAGRDLPADVERAARLLVVSAYLARGRDPSLRSVNVQGVAAESYQDARAGNGGLPAVVAEMLAPYREWPA